jgi:hypothetical protein
MIRSIAHCPYCYRGHLALDCDNARLLFNPDCLDPEPCPHLAASTGALEVDQYDPRGPSQRVPSRCLDWLWLRGPGFVTETWNGCAVYDLQYYLLAVALDARGDISFPPPPPFIIAGGSATQREERRPRTGEFRVAGPGLLSGILDAWAFYAQDADRFVRGIYLALAAPA